MQSTVGLIKKFRLLLTLEKFKADRDRVTEPDDRSKQDRPQRKER
jgi:hypothetical protein